jgi:hypothetical protein
MAKITPASELGQAMKNARNQARVELGRLIGKDLTKINNNEQVSLLVAIGQMIGLIGPDNKLSTMGKTVWLAPKVNGIIDAPCHDYAVHAEADGYVVISTDDSSLATIEGEMILYSPTMPGGEKPSVEELRLRRDYCKRLGISTQRFVILFGAETARKNRKAAAANLINWMNE